MLIKSLIAKSDFKDSNGISLWKVAFEKVDLLKICYGRSVLGGLLYRLCTGFKSLDPSKN